MDVGIEIRVLREKRGMSARELAGRIGLSPSQVSRLESGQRRIDMQVLHRIASALDVSPATFFSDQDVPPPDVEAVAPGGGIGRAIRIERHKRHLSADDVARKIGRQRSFVLALESGTVEEVDAETAERLARALRLDPKVFHEGQQETIARLRGQVERLTRMAAQQDGSMATTEDGHQVRTTPVLGAIGAGYPAEFAADGRPIATVTAHVLVPGVDEAGAFALRVSGDRMEQAAHPSFRDGEILVFSAEQPVLGRDFAFARLASAMPHVAQVFYDGGAVRLQPLNRAYPADTFHRNQVLRLWKVVAHVARP